MQLTNDHDLQINYIWNNLYFIPLCLPGLDNIISNFCTLWTCSKNFKQPVITLDLDTIYKPSSPDCMCIWSILLYSALPQSS